MRPVAPDADFDRGDERIARETAAARPARYRERGERVREERIGLLAARDRVALTGHYPPQILVQQVLIVPGVVDGRASIRVVLLPDQLAHLIAVLHYEPEHRSLCRPRAVGG